MRHLLCLLPLTLAATAAPACAQEIFAGVYAHGVNTPFTFDTGEHGVDVQAGYRFAPSEALGVIGKPAPYVFASINSRGDTSLAGAGLSWKLGRRDGPVYVRPGIGMVVHDGPARRIDPMQGVYTDLGSRVLFEPEIAIGARIAPRWTVEASWVHVSHARLFNAHQNPGLDMTLAAAWR
jgi:lipid A 3-O-deacylase